MKSGKSSFAMTALTDTDFIKASLFNRLKDEINKKIELDMESQFDFHEIPCSKLHGIIQDGSFNAAQITIYDADYAIFLGIFIEYSKTEYDAGEPQEKMGEYQYWHEDSISETGTEYATPKMEIFVDHTSSNKLGTFYRPLFEGFTIASFIKNATMKDEKGVEFAFYPITGIMRKGLIGTTILQEFNNFMYVKIIPNNAAGFSASARIIRATAYVWTNGTIQVL